MILLSCCHLIASTYKATFITSGFTWAYTFVPPLHSQQPSSSICHMQVCYLLPLLMVLLAVTSLPFHLDILVHEQLYVFIDRQVHRHLIDCIPSCALNNVFDSALLEAIVLVLLRGRRTLVILGNIATLMTSNMWVENQNKLDDWHGMYLCNSLWRFCNFQHVTQ